MHRRVFLVSPISWMRCNRRRVVMLPYDPLYLMIDGVRNGEVASRVLALNNVHTFHLWTRALEKRSCVPFTARWKIDISFFSTIIQSYHISKKNFHIKYCGIICSLIFIKIKILNLYFIIVKEYPRFLNTNNIRKNGFYFFAKVLHYSFILQNN